MKTYDGLKQFPEDKEELNKWIDALKRNVNCDEGHLSDRACVIGNYAKLLTSKAKELFEKFEAQ